MNPTTVQLVGTIAQPAPLVGGVIVLAGPRRIGDPGVRRAENVDTSAREAT